ncbi:MAG: cytochrome P450 [Acidobacteria bacterium]|nr:cytochrome P450 [Acidobacteriota bacterium]
MVDDVEELGFDAFCEGLPLDDLDRLRGNKPVFRTTLADGTTAWNLVRYDDIATVLAASRHYSVAPVVVDLDQSAESDGSTERWELRAAMALNAPTHGLHKQRLASAVKRDRVEAFRTVVRDIATRFARSCKQKRRADAVEDFAAPLAAEIACSYLGIAPANRDYVRRLSANFMGDSLPDVAIGSHRDLELGACALNAVCGSPMRATTELVYESWRKVPWLAPEFVAHAGRWEIEELALQTITAGVAGLRNCIVTAIVCVAAQWEIAKSDTSTWLSRQSKVADEVIRHATPLLRVRRILATDAVWHGTTIRAGETLFAWLLGANFDPDTFSDPRGFQPFRTPNPHLSFTGGAHACLGAPLARMEVEEVIRAMLLEWTGLTLDAPPVRFTSNIVNEYVHLPIRVS